MSCPNCGAPVTEGALHCPTCGFEVGVTQRIPKAQGSWCPSCGALVPSGEAVCPKCGVSVTPAAIRRRVRDLDLPTIYPEDEPSAARQAEQIESALPAQDGSDSPARAHDHMPKARFMLLAAFFSVVVVGGAVVAITHPWDPTANDKRATEDADISMMGFPGEVQTLTGQDTTRTGDSAQVAAQQSTYDILVDLHAQLGALDARLRDDEETFFSLAFGGDEDARRDARAEVEALSIDVSNTIQVIGQVSGANGEYAQDIENLVTLGNWLRNRVDALSRAWKLDFDYLDPSAVRDIVESPVTSSDYQEYARLFEEGYDDLAPEER